VLGEDGIDVRTGATITAVAREGDVTTVTFGERDSGDTLVVDAVLVAVGRSPDTGELALSSAGVELDERGYVVVNDRLQTTNARIWAAGDLTGHPQFTHVAGVHASTAAGNAILGLRRTVDTATIPRVTYTQPEVAAFGVSAGRARSSDSLRILDLPHDEVDRAVTEGATRGITRLIADRKGHLVGAIIVGPRAGESLAELVLAARNGLRIRDLAAVMHAYPTYADGPWKAAIADVQHELNRPVVSTATTAMTRFRRHWVSR